MSAVWFMGALAALQVGACVALAADGKGPLAGIYLCYGISNLLMIWVAIK